MNRIIVFQKANFQGIHKEFTSTQKDLKQSNFNMCIESVKVFGQPWLLYKEADCVGDNCVYEEGEYPTIEWSKNIKSIELITDDLSEPKLSLYFENIDSKVFTKETNLAYGIYNKSAVSCRAEKGVWVLYETFDVKESFYIVVRPAQKFLDLHEEEYDNIVSYVRPLKPGKAKVTTDVLWDEMTKGDEVVESVKTLTGVNYSSEETEFVVTSTTTVEASMTYSFNFSNSTSIEVGLTGTIPLIGEVSASVSNTFTFSTGKSESSTVTTEIEVEVPAKIPPKSRLLVNVLKKKYTARVPTKVTVERNNVKSILMGELVCESGRTVYAEYSTEDL